MPPGAQSALREPRSPWPAWMTGARGGKGGGSVWCPDGHPGVGWLAYCKDTESHIFRHAFDTVL
jgi:hypothetical protein